MERGGTDLLDFVDAVHVAELDRMLLQRLELCSTSAGLEKARVFQENGENDQHDWGRIREEKKTGDVSVQKPPRPAKTTKRTMRMVREPLAEERSTTGRDQW